MKQSEKRGLSDVSYWLGACLVLMFPLSFVALFPQAYSRPAPACLPSDNPVAAGLGELAPAWTDGLKWTKVIDVLDYPGASIEERLGAAQDEACRRGGGVIYFPAGVYRFSENIVLRDGVVIRGAQPSAVTDARSDDYVLSTRFKFPKYQWRLEGKGSPISTAFKGITLQHPATDSNCGLVHVDIDRGHIDFGNDAAFRAGSNRLVFGCILSNAASASSTVPQIRHGQHSWQRYTHGHRAAIGVCAQRNLLVANNRLARSGDDNFAMRNYIVLKPRGVRALGFDPRKHGYEQLLVPGEVVFDYDNRPGIYANHYSIGSFGAGLPNGTPATHPQGFRKGIVIRNNYVYSTGRCAIAFTGDGTICSGNVVRMPDNIWRPTCDGLVLSDGSSTNDTRAIQCRGYRWRVEDNDYIVHANRSFERRIRICDGEGIMHENHHNSKVLNSTITGNRGNAYLSIWRVEVDGLLVQGNRLRLDVAPRVSGRGTAEPTAVCVLSMRGAKSPRPCRQVRVLDNRVSRGGILISGSPCEGNEIRRNQVMDGGGAPPPIVNEGDALADSNLGFREAGL